jgi:hypothetical protein
LLLNGDVPACLTIGTIATFIASSVSPPLLIGTCAFCVLALTPTLTALAFLLLRITNTNLRTTIRADAKLKLGLRD